MHYRIQDAAAQLGVSESTIRAYERRGLLPPAERSHSGQRVYTADDIAAMRRVLFPQRERVPA